ncbi:MAG: NAD(P)/FAD-dependent oxidoreductase [Myxococcales bacterium]|nr:FAD-dependent monooxygenase [Myxococcota bacterium]MDW8282975.1 NAD(P)/FAD-dependent oxidoreductase [Myxococcales bacterium]
MADVAADVIVVGAGVTGCAVAAALADGRRRILVLEARKGHKPRFAGEYIHPPGTQVLDNLGFLPALRARGGIDVDGFAVVKQQPLPPTLLPYREIPGGRPTGFAMEHRELVEGMRAEIVRRPGVELRLGHRVEEILRDGSGRACGVRTEHGPLRAPLVLGCDGRHSKVRPLLGLPEQARLVSFTVAVHLPEAAALLPHRGFGHIFLGAWGPILMYPVSARDVRGCFDVSADLSGGPAGAARHIRDDYAGYLPPPLRAALLAALERERPQIAANESIRTDRSVAPGAAIVGDAGGCSHPLTATGMTIGFLDAERLGRLLAPLPNLTDARAVDEALRRYEVERYRFVRAREILADALYEVFRAADPGTRAIRQGIFRYWQAGEGARARSMALLSGAESRLGVFLREYMSVVGRSAGSALLGVEDGLPRRLTVPERGAALLGLGRKVWEKSRLVLRDVRQEALR